MNQSFRIPTGKRTIDSQTRKMSSISFCWFVAMERFKIANKETEEKRGSEKGVVLCINS